MLYMVLSVLRPSIRVKSSVTGEGTECLSVSFLHTLCAKSSLETSKFESVPTVYITPKFCKISGLGYLIFSSFPSPLSLFGGVFYVVVDISEILRY